jgi:hypothetical protein
MTAADDRTGPDRDRRRAAVAVALRTGLLRRCPAHGAVYDPGQHDYQGACMAAAFLVNQADPVVAPFGDDRAALTGLLRSICGGYPPGCPGCAGAATAPADAGGGRPR